MQEPCCDHCLPTGMFSDSPKCVAKDEDKHCIDCAGYTDTSHGAYCSLCTSFWCSDSQNVFAGSFMCDHRIVSEAERNKAKENSSESDDVSEDYKRMSMLEDGICPQCFFKIPALHCKVLTCELSHDVFFQNWLAFCTDPVVLGSYDLSHRKRGHRDVRKFEVHFRRQPSNEAGPKSLWNINQEIAWVKENGYTQPFLSVELAVTYIKTEIQNYLSQGYTPHIGYYNKHAGYGILSHSRLFPEETEKKQAPQARDSSPKRRKRKPKSK